MNINASFYALWVLWIFDMFLITILKQNLNVWGHTKINVGVLNIARTLIMYHFCVCLHKNEISLISNTFLFAIHTLWMTTMHGPWFHYTRKRCARLKYILNIVGAASCRKWDFEKSRMAFLVFIWTHPLWMKSYHRQYALTDTNKTNDYNWSYFTGLCRKNTGYASYIIKCN